MFNLFSSDTRAYKNLNGRQFKEQFQNVKKAVLLDVRTPGEFASGTIKGAKNMDMMSPSFKSAISKLDKDIEYFLFCRSGNRSGQACNMMSKEGFKVYNLKSGVDDWPV